jgi:hypothetical protein
MKARILMEQTWAGFNEIIRKPFTESMVADILKDDRVP